MKPKTIGTVVLLAFVAVSVGYLIVNETRTPPAAAPTPAGPAAEPATQPITAAAEDPVTDGAAPAAAKPAHKVIAYYFHSTQRCATCLKIERLTAEALREQFATALADGTLEWHEVNVDEPWNRQYVQDYQLVTSSLVFVDKHGGEQRDWILMDRVWQLVHGDELEFKDYVAQQAREYLESDS